MTSTIFLVDVEATGKSSYSGILTEFGVVELQTGKWFRGQLWDTIPNPDLPAQPLPVKENFLYTTGNGDFDLDHGFSKTVKNEKELAQAHIDWLQNLANGNRITFMSDNPGYDFERINVFFDKNGLDNPYGWSSRRIGDYAGGLTNRFTATSKWKQLRKTVHNHQSHYDSQGNRQALLALLRLENEMNELFPEFYSTFQELFKEERKRK